jgi:hypothetical protein
MGQSEGGVRLVSPTFTRERLDAIFRETRPFTDTGHYLYPADSQGNHAAGFFAFEPIARVPAFVDAIADDIAAWIRLRRIEFDVLFAPAQPSVRPLAEAVAERVGRPTAYWEYLPSGRFGDRLVEGSVSKGARALVFNGVSLQGRCVGLRLPEFVERLGGTTVAAAVFAKGVGPMIRETEARMGPRFYATVQVAVPVFPPSECPACRAESPPPVSWRTFAERVA